jgi:hypothetical protein
VVHILPLRLAARRLFGADALGPASTEVEGKSSLGPPRQSIADLTFEFLQLDAAPKRPDCSALQ